MPDAAEPRLITPDQRPPPRLPRVFLAVFLVCLCVAAAGGKYDRIVAVATMIGLIPGAAVASWATVRLHHALERRGRLFRLTAALLAPGASLVLLVVSFIAAAELAEGAMVPTLLFTLWMTSALSGAALIVVLDEGISPLVRDFESRVTVAVLGLTVAASIIVGVGAHGAALVQEKLAIAAEEGELEVRMEDEVKRGDDALFIANEVADELELLILVLFAFSVLPAVLTASRMLGRAVTWRLQPLGAGFESLRGGDLDVRVEEGGSEEFVELARGFNDAVADLFLAQRMDRAFGAYVSEAVRDRIKAQRGATELPAETRDATVVFADIRGFTSMSESLEPATVLDVLNRYFSRITPLVDEYEGYLNKFVGDEFMVVFGAPLDQPDHAQRAIRCSLAVQEAIAAMNDAGEFEAVGGLRVGIGLASGPMVAGNLGSDKHTEYTVIGDTVNLAARLCGKAPGGAVWVNDVAAAAHDGPKEAQEATEMKGKSGVIVPWEVR
jgi:class 3 adenylate cyclase